MPRKGARQDHREPLRDLTSSAYATRADLLMVMQADMTHSAGAVFGIRYAWYGRITQLTKVFVFYLV